MQDLPLLTEHLLKKINARQHTAVRHIAESSWRRLKDYAWPGNIRELENELTRAAVLARGDTLTPELLALPADGDEEEPDKQDEGASLRLISLEKLEREHVQAILAHVRWHKSRACEILGISQSTLERKIEKYGLS